MENNNGRPKKYTDEDILSILENYINKHPGKSIGYAALERETGVPQHIFKYRAKEFIKKYNKENRVPVENTKEIKLPSANDIMLKYQDKPLEMKAQIQILLDMIVKLQKYKESETTIQEIKETYEIEIEKLNAKIQKLEKTNEKLNDTLSRVFIDSENPNKRRTQGIKDNIIELTPENMEKYKKIIDDLTL